MKEQSAPFSDPLHLRRLFVLVLAAYLLLTVCFYFLAGEQIRIRATRGAVGMQPADTWVAELSEGVVVEQTFPARIDRIERVSVQWGSSFRRNSGTLTMELLQGNGGAVLLRQDFDAGAVAEGEVLTMEAEVPVEVDRGVPLVLRLTADSVPGSAVAPLAASGAAQDGFLLSCNGEAVPGMLCFSADGSDYTWMGLHYWEFIAGFGLLLIAAFVVVWRRYRSGKRSFLVNALAAMQKYRFLIRQLVNRDFKTKYKRSILGVFWSFLNPLLMMLVQYFVFSTIFRSDISNFAAYLIIGTVMFNFFTESCGMTLNSILGNAGLITKVYMPKYIYPLTRTMSSVVNLVISLAPMILVCLITGVRFRPATVLALFFFICLIIFALGFGMVLATSMVFFRDTQFLWGVLSLMWMYATPIFYPVSILPDHFRALLNLNPLYHFLSSARICILEGISPEPIAYVRCLVIAMGMLLVGAVVFYKNQDKFVLYL